MITPADFRLRYPEFGDSTEYTDARIEMFICDAIDDIESSISH